VVGKARPLGGGNHQEDHKEKVGTSSRQSKSSISHGKKRDDHKAKGDVESGIQREVRAVSRGPWVRGGETDQSLVRETHSKGKRRGKPELKRKKALISRTIIEEAAKGRSPQAYSESCPKRRSIAIISPKPSERVRIASAIKQKIRASTGVQAKYQAED